MEKDGRVLRLRRIHVEYHLKLAAAQRQTAERVHGFHAQFCPVARSLEGAIVVTTSLQLESLEG